MNNYYIGVEVPIVSQLDIDLSSVLFIILLIIRQLKQNLILWLHQQYIHYIKEIQLVYLKIEMIH